MRKNGMLSFVVMAGLLIGTALPASATLFQPHVMNTLEFSYVESIFGPDGAKKGGLTLAPGDQLIGIIAINRITAGAETLFAAGPASQLTGIYAHKVLSVPPYFVQGGVSYDPHLQTAAYAHVEFGNPDRGAFTDGSSSFNLAAILAPGEMLALWLDQGSSATVYTTGGSLADGVAKATDGLPFLSAGIGNSGYFYSHTNPFITLSDIMQGALIGQAFSGLEVMTNATGHTLAPIPNPDDLEKDVATPMVLSIDLSINPAGLFDPQNSPWTLAGTGTAQIYPAPEPSTFALFGVAGAVIALWRLRKRP